MMIFQLVINHSASGMNIDINEIKKSNSKRKEMTKMKKLLKKFETAMMAVAFAEEGEFETARQLMREDERETKRPATYKRQTDRKVLRAE